MLGSGKMHHDWPGSLVIRRGDIERIHDYAREKCSLRDFLLVRLPMKLGLRTGEIATLCIENIDFETRTIKVLDSKKKVLFPLFLDMLTLQLIKDLCAFRTHGYVFRQSRSWKYVKGDKPLSVQEIWHVIHSIGEAAGFQNIKPRHLRQYFAGKWVEEMKQPNSQKTLVGLQQYLRHESLETTQIYIAKMRFPEDLQKEYDSTQGGPIIETEESTPAQAPRAPAKVCSDCGSLPVCKFAATMPKCAMACCHKASNPMQRTQSKTSEFTR